MQNSCCGQFAFVKILINNCKSMTLHTPRLITLIPLRHLHQEDIAMPALTEKQIQIVKDTWEVPKKDMEGSGEAILFRYFEKYPHNQQKFPAFKNLPLDSLKASKSFRSHALRVVSVFQAAIDAFDTANVVENLNKVWAPIGQSHDKRRIPKQAFDELRDVILEVMTAVCSLDQEQQQAWVVLFDNVYAIIFGNYKGTQ